MTLSGHPGFACVVALGRSFVLLTVVPRQSALESVASCHRKAEHEVVSVTQV